MYHSEVQTHRVLTDPCLLINNENFEVLLSERRKNFNHAYLERENTALSRRVKDLEKTVRINKEIVNALLNDGGKY